MTNKLEIYEYGFVRLEDSMADDLSVVNSARVSFGKRKDNLDDSDIKLVSFLMRNRHGTPFEHNSFRFHIKCPIFVAREWFRHRIGSFNEFSQRYSEVQPEFYAPLEDHVRIQTGKPGQYKFKQADLTKAEQVKDLIGNLNMEMWAWYKSLVDDGIAKELARIVLPLTTFTEFYWTINARSLMNFISLRNEETALLEIREYAKLVEIIFKERMPNTYQAFIDCDRIAP